MRSRHALAIGVVCLLALAGCTASPGATTPPGVSETGVTDTSALVEAHTEALQSTSFTVRSTRTMRSTDPAFAVTSNQTWKLDANETLRGSVVSTTNVTGAAPQQYRQRPERRSVWRHGRTTVERIEANGSITERQVDFLNTSVKLNRALYRQTIYALTTSSNTSVDRVSREETELYRITARLNDTGVSTNASMTLFVDGDGVVREIQTGRTVRYRTGPRRITQRVRITDVGTTVVDRPTWVSSAADDSSE